VTDPGTSANRFALYPSLAGRTAFVTGGAAGIGAEIVRQLLVQGARVAFIDIDVDAAQLIVGQAQRDGYEAPFFQPCDVCDIRAVRDAIATASRAVGPITLLVNNAGNDERHRLEDVSIEIWEERLAINLRHQFFAAQAVASMMGAEGGGSIVNIGSITAHVGFPDLAAYSTSKGGIEGLTRALARDLGPRGIRVNCVVPGWILTERQRALWLTPELERRVTDLQSVKELLVPADVARLVLWLGAEDSRHCTAQRWIVDGGWM
jgi:D-xylose 1-dehydrogenase